MITELYIDNFKSLVDFRLPCHSLTCLTGVNNSGKTSILQAVDMLSAVAAGNVGEWLKTRGWNPRDLKTKSNRIKHNVVFEIYFTINGIGYLWAGKLNLNTLGCGSEIITRKSHKSEALLVAINNSYIVLGSPRKSVDFHYEGSILAFLKARLLTEELRQVKKFLHSIKSLDLLNPMLIRKKARTAEGGLGMGGEKLSAFLHDLSKEKRGRIIEQMRSLFKPFRQVSIRAKRSGLKELRIEESFQTDAGFPVITEAKHVSDGFLRVLALFSQLQTDNAVLLFDEIEDGLNHEIMECLMDEMVRSQQQIFFTTHSPMILNFLEDEVAQKAVMLIYRDPETGITRSCKFFDIPRIRERLEYMGPGEVFANAGLNELP